MFGGCFPCCAVVRSNGLLVGAQRTPPPGRHLRRVERNEYEILSLRSTRVAAPYLSARFFPQVPVKLLALPKNPFLVVFTEEHMVTPHEFLRNDTVVTGHTRKLSIKISVLSRLDPFIEPQSPAFLFNDQPRLSGPEDTYLDP